MGGLIPFVPGRIRGLAMRYSRKARRSVGVEKEAKAKGKGFFGPILLSFWFRKPPAMPVEMSRKKAFTLSIEGRGLLKASRTVTEGFRLTGSACLQAAGQGMPVK